MKATSNARRPGKSILDPTFPYRPSHATDLRETFERVRRELGQARDINVVRLPVRDAR
ncbi:MAG TPA: hypothetical protein VFJ70_01615 [Burkholderiales bacterium]|nr:hypothetical protein [Burkholderiales bacterium]